MLALIAFAVSGTSLLLSPAAHGSIIAYDGFDYTTGALEGKGTAGDGWGGAWRDTLLQTALIGGASVQEPGWTYNSLPVSGNRARLVGFNGESANAYRDLSSTIGNTSGEVWVSFIGHVTGPSSGVGYIAFYNATDANEGGAAGQGRKFFIGSGGFSDVDGVRHWGLLAQNSHTSSASTTALTTAAATSQTFLLTRLIYGDNGNLTSMDLWINPALGDSGALGAADASLSSALTQRDYSFDRIRMFGINGETTTFDEIRIGTTFDAVAIPEPASIGLLFAGLSALLVVGLRRTRRG